MKLGAQVVAVIAAIFIIIFLVSLAVVLAPRFIPEDADEEVLPDSGQTYEITGVDAGNDIVTVQHTGSVRGTTNTVNIFVGSTKINCEWNMPGDWPAGETRICLVLGGFSCIAGSIIEVSGPANIDSENC